MSEAKKKIVQSSIELFNNNGFSNVSQHKVANHLGISPGNVTYHFKKKSDILEFIYEEYENSIENHFNFFLDSDMLISNLDLLIKSWFKENYYYRFLFSELENVLRTSDKIGKSYRLFVSKINNLFLAIYKMLIRLKYVSPENIKDLNNNLTPILHLVTTFHCTYQKITLDGASTPLFLKSIPLFYGVFHPYLNELGIKEFRRISLDTV